jgi:hypothetical protein
VKISYPNGDEADATFVAGRLDGAYRRTTTDGRVIAGSVVNGKLIPKDATPERRSSTDPSLQRKRGLDSMMCEDRADGKVSGQSPVAYGSSATSAGLTAFGTALLIGLNKKEAYEKCMKALGWDP